MSTTNGFHRMELPKTDLGFQLISQPRPGSPVVNREQYERQALVANLTLLRQQIFKRLIDPRRDIDGECGYPAVLRIDDYKLLYEREGVATRTVALLPEESWAMDPEVYEDEDESTVTPFEEKLNELVDQHNLWSTCQTADEVSGIGRYGVMLLGFDDGRKLSDPVRPGYGLKDEKPGKNRELLFIRCFDEKLLQITKFDTDKKSPRYGMPIEYNVTLYDLTDDPPLGTGTNGPVMTTEPVHWTRIIHLADNCKTSKVFGIPRMKPVYNRLADIRKTMGASGEMFWRGAIPGLSIEAMPQALEAGIVLDPDAVKEEVASYSNSLQRYMAFVGMTAKSLAPQVSDPTTHIQIHLNAIAIHFGCPLRKFMGSEQAQLASGQDDSVWNKRVDRRRKKYVTPHIIRPLIDRLIWVGVLPQPQDDYECDWPDLNTPSDKDKAAVFAQRTTALSTYVTGGLEQLMPPQEFLTKEAGYTKEEAEAIIDAGEEHQLEMLDQQMTEFGQQQDVLGEYGADIESQQQADQDQQDQEFQLKKEQIKASAKKKATTNAWSDEARKASAEARRRKAHGPPLAGKEVDGREVLDDIPNQDSISASLDDYEVLDGIREIRLDEFEQQGKPSFYSASEKKRTYELAREIRNNKKIKPLIVVYDDQSSPYILEGGHRFDALRLLKAKSFPALVVRDSSKMAANAWSKDVAKAKPGDKKKKFTLEDAAADPHTVLDHHAKCLAKRHVLQQKVKHFTVKLKSDDLIDNAGVTKTGVDSLGRRYRIVDGERVPVDADGNETTPRARRASRRIEWRTGKVLTRTYQGVRHDVQVLGQNRFQYRGLNFSSLTAVARHITGARSINGRAFFNIAGTVAPLTGSPSSVQPSTADSSTPVLARTPAITATQSADDRRREAQARVDAYTSSRISSSSAGVAGAEAETRARAAASAVLPTSVEGLQRVMRERQAAYTALQGVHPYGHPKRVEAFRLEQEARAALVRAQQATTRAPAPAPASVSQPVSSSGAAIGTILVRRYQGRRHEVTVRGRNNYEYQGQRYNSLTAVARQITGARSISGPAFFRSRTRFTPISQPVVPSRVSGSRPSMRPTDSGPRVVIASSASEVPPVGEMPLGPLSPKHQTTVIDRSSLPTQIAVDTIFGRANVTLSEDHIAALACTIPGGTAKITGSGDTLYIGATSPNGTRSSRSISKRNGRIIASNNSFFMDSRDQGQGYQVFREQIRALVSLGVDELHTCAGGSGGGEGSYRRDMEARARGENPNAGRGGMNGYYTWPRFGYDGDLSDYMKTKLRQKNPEWGQYTKVSQVMATEAGREWWYDHGDGMSLKFDLRPGSQSLRTLKEYTDARDAARRARRS